MTALFIPGPAGRLEAKYSRSDDADAPVALVLHPHPQYGGNFNNKVVFVLSQALRRRGFATLRFNFRGVGHSDGHWDQGHGEVSDAAAAYDWLRDNHPNASGHWIAGYSFGSWIGMQLLIRRPGTNGFVAAAPPVNMLDFGFLAPCPTSGLILHGSKDALVPETEVHSLARRLGKQRDTKVEYALIEGADHFFTDHTDALSQQLDLYLKRVLP